LLNPLKNKLLFFMKKSINPQNSQTEIPEITIVLKPDEGDEIKTVIPSPVTDHVWGVTSVWY
jgi:hypothetical protein